MCDLQDVCKDFQLECIGREPFKCYEPPEEKAKQNPQAEQDTASCLSELLATTPLGIWVNVHDMIPPDGLRVLTYSPAYANKDEAMLYRMMDSQFVRIASDVSHWMIPSLPAAG